MNKNSCNYVYVGTKVAVAWVIDVGNYKRGYMI